MLFVLILVMNLLVLVLVCLLGLVFPGAVFAFGLVLRFVIVVVVLSVVSFSLSRLCLVALAHLDPRLQSYPVPNYLLVPHQTA